MLYCYGVSRKKNPKRLLAFEFTDGSGSDCSGDCRGSSLGHRDRHERKQNHDVHPFFGLRSMLVWLRRFPEREGKVKNAHLSEQHSSAITVATEATAVIKAIRTLTGIANSLWVKCYVIWLRRFPRIFCSDKTSAPLFDFQSACCNCNTSILAISVPKFKKKSFYCEKMFDLSSKNFLSFYFLSFQTSILFSATINHCNFFYLFVKKIT